MNEWLTQATEKFSEINWYTWAILLALVVVGVVLIARSNRQSSWNTRQLAAAAMCLAISFILSNFRLFRMPQGGSVTLLSALPIVAFAYVYGLPKGIIVGFAYGILQLIQDPYIVHPAQMLMDYPLAFGALALGAGARKLPIADILKLPLAVMVGSLARAAFHIAAGAIFFGEYAAVGETALVYSIGYNLPFLLVDGGLCAVMCFVPGVARIPGIIAGVRPQHAA